MPSSNVVQLPSIPAEIRERIIEAADALFEQAGHATFPTVDLVRRAARADMNAVSSVMREWRREQTARAAPMPVQIPEAVAAAGGAAMAALWLQAQALANESLQAAQGAWEAERAQLETLREEMAGAYDALAMEVEALRVELAVAQDATTAARAEADRAAHQVLELQPQLQESRAQAARLSAEVDALRQTVEAAHTELARAQTQLAADAERHKEQRQHAAQEAQRLAERLTDATAVRDQALKRATTAESARATAREDEARLVGQVDALREQLSALTQALGKSAPGAGGR